MRETIGLLGGSFNPIHYGHLAMAQAAKDELKLDRVILVPAGNPPHKHQELADKRDRLRMVELAAGGRFEISATEVERLGKTFTVDTLEEFQKAYPDAELFMIIGADTLHEIAGWRNAPRVFELCRFAVFSRGDLPWADVSEARTIRLETKVPLVSATDIRERVHKGLSLEGLTPSAVENYIGLKRLYDPPKRMGDKAMRKRLKEELPNGRYKHSLGVEKTIRTLAKRWGHDEKRAALTGLLHDCAKGLKLPEMIGYLQTCGVSVDGIRKTSVALLHAPAGAAMARAVYGVTDPEMLHAIAIHNTGSASMGLLDKLVCVADMIEPSRKDYEWIARLRELSVQDLDAAVCETLRIKLAYIHAHGKCAHPDTSAAFEAMQREREG